MKCPACGARIAVVTDTETNRWNCVECGLIWVCSGLRNSGTAPVLSHYAWMGDKEWKPVPSSSSGYLLVLASREEA